MLLSHTTTERRASRRRRTVAAGFEHAVSRAGHHGPLIGAEVPVDRAAVLGSADRLLALAAVLRSQRELPAVGVDEARHLLTDGAGPLYGAGAGSLAHALTRVEIALGLR